MKRQKYYPSPVVSSVSVSRRRPEHNIAEMMRENERILAEAMARHPEPPPPRPQPQPMATIDIDPLAGIGWDSAMELWARIQTPVMFAVWSIGCFLLGRLS